MVLVEPWGFTVQGVRVCSLEFGAFTGKDYMLQVWGFAFLRVNALSCLGFRLGGPPIPLSLPNVHHFLFLGLEVL